jgi:hypothetical protein
MPVTPEYKWECVTENAVFAARDGAGALTFNGKMWLLGGWNQGDKEHFPMVCNSEVWSSRDGKNWELELNQAPWEPRHTAGYVTHRDRMWIVGGDCIQRHYQPDVWSSADGINWDLISDAAPWGKRVLHYTVAFKDRIWVMGGQTLPQFAQADEHFYNDIWSSEDGNNWECVLKEAPWQQRGMIGGSVVFNDRIWILGGGTYDTPQVPDRTFYNDIWSSTDGINWEKHLEHAPWTARQYHDVAVFDNKMWIFEGWNRENRNDVWYSPDGIEWHELPNTPWLPRHAASVFVYKNALWMVAGNNMTPDVWKLVKC